MDIIDETTQTAPIVSTAQSSSGLSISVYVIYIYSCDYFFLTDIIIYIVIP